MNTIIVSMSAILFLPSAADFVISWLRTNGAQRTASRRIRSGVRVSARRASTAPPVLSDHRSYPSRASATSASQQVLPCTEAHRIIHTPGRESRLTSPSVSSPSRNGRGITSRRAPSRGTNNEEDSPLRASLHSSQPGDARAGASSDREERHSRVRASRATDNTPYSREAVSRDTNSDSRVRGPTVSSHSRGPTSTSSRETSSNSSTSSRPRCSPRG